MVSNFEKSHSAIKKIKNAICPQDAPLQLAQSLLRTYIARRLNV